MVLGSDPGAEASGQSSGTTFAPSSGRQAERSWLLIIQNSSSLPLETNGKRMGFGNESPVGYLGLKQNLCS